MATSSSAVFASPQVGFLPVSEKLTRTNHAMWRLTVLSAIRDAQLGDFIEPSSKPPEQYLTPAKADGAADDKKPSVLNPEYSVWHAKDQTVLNFLLTSLSKEIFSQVTTSAQTAAKAWATIEGLFASQSRARVIATRMALATASKGSSTIAKYVTKMKALSDDMASAGKKLEDDEMVSYILTGLASDRDFNSVVTAVTTRVEPITVTDLYTQLTSHEQRVEIRNNAEGSNNPSVNMVAKGGNRGNNSQRGRGGGGRGGYGCGFQRGGRGGGRNPNFLSGVHCQLCNKEGHVVATCRKRFDSSFTGASH